MLRGPPPFHRAKAVKPAAAASGGYQTRPASSMLNVLNRGGSLCGAPESMTRYRELLVLSADSEKGKRVDMGKLRAAVAKLRRDAETSAEEGEGRDRFWFQWIAFGVAGSPTPQRELLAFLVKECHVPLHVVPPEGFDPSYAILTDPDCTVLFNAISKKDSSPSKAVTILYLLDHLDAESAAQLDRTRATDGLGLLHMAALQGLTAVVERLVELGARVDVPDAKEGHLPICLAVINGHEAAARVLLAAHRAQGKQSEVLARPCCNPEVGAKPGDAGAMAAAAGAVRTSLLAHAILEERLPMAQLLVKEAGAGLQTTWTPEGAAAAAAPPEATLYSTATHLAAYKPSLVLLRWLLSAEGPAFGMAVDFAEPMGGQTMLHAACSWREDEGKRLEVVQWLIEEKGADATLKDHAGRTAADTAKAFGLMTVYDYLTRGKREREADEAMAALLADLEVESTGGKGRAGKSKKKKKDRNKAGESEEVVLKEESAAATAVVATPVMVGPAPATATAPAAATVGSTSSSAPRTLSSFRPSPPIAPSPAPAAAPAHARVFAPAPAPAAAPAPEPELKIDRALLARITAQAPASFRCPLSKVLLLSPVVASDGYTYERAALQAHFDRAKAGTSCHALVCPRFIYTDDEIDHARPSPRTHTAKTPLLSPITREALDPIYFDNRQFRETVRQWCEEKRRELARGPLPEEDEEALWGAAGW